MSRLTKKQGDLYYPNNENDIFPDDGSNAIRLLQVIGKYEELEAELGIDLITLFKALKDGIFINKKGYVNSAYEDKKFNEEDSYYNSLQLYKSYDGYFLQDTYSPYGDSECGEIGCCVSLKDYGKTWALSKYDLEEQDDE